MSVCVFVNQAPDIPRRYSLDNLPDSPRKSPPENSPRTIPLDIQNIPQINLLNILPGQPRTFSSNIPFTPLGKFTPDDSSQGIKTSAFIVLLVSKRRQAWTATFEPCINLVMMSSMWTCTPLHCTWKRSSTPPSGPMWFRKGLYFCFILSLMYSIGV